MLELTLQFAASLSAQERTDDVPTARVADNSPLRLAKSAMTAPDRQQQIAQAEEILGDRLQQVGFVKGLFFGQYLGERLLPYPDAGRRCGDDRPGRATAAVLRREDRSRGDRPPGGDSATA